MPGGLGDLLVGAGRREGGEVGGGEDGAVRGGSGVGRRGEGRGEEGERLPRALRVHEIRHTLGELERRAGSGQGELRGSQCDPQLLGIGEATLVAATAGLREGGGTGDDHPKKVPTNPQRAMGRVTGSRTSPPAG